MSLVDWPWSYYPITTKITDKMIKMTREMDPIEIPATLRDFAVLEALLDSS